MLGLPGEPWTPAAHGCGQQSGARDKEWAPRQGLWASDLPAPQDRGPERPLETPQWGCG